MLRVTPDTNVIVSGLYGSGNPREILADAEAGKIRIIISQAILNEVGDVLQRPKFGWTAEEASAATEWLRDIADIVEPKQAVDVVKADPDDNRIIECALEGKADYLVTGDKHLLNLKQIGFTKIVKPAHFVQIEQCRD